MAVVRQGPPPPVTGASNAGVEGPGTSRIVGDRLMTCWTCEQQLRQSALHLRRRIIQSIFITACNMHDKDRTEQCTQL